MSTQSFFKTIFLDLQERIKTEVPEIRFIEQNIGQIGIEDFRKMVSFPAVIIDFSNTTFTALQGNVQLAEATITITLIFETFSQSYNLAPSSVKEKALEFLDIEQKVYQALQGWENGNCTPMVRMNATSQNELGLRIRILNFSTSFEDWSLDNDQYVEVAYAFAGSIEK